MNYKPELGMIGNIKLLFAERNSTNNKVFNETTDRHFTGIAISKFTFQYVFPIKH